MTDDLTSEGVSLLEEARGLAFNKTGVWIDTQSPRVPALDLYTGHLYSVNGFKDAVERALSQGVHCLVVSGGLGLVGANEQIPLYEAYMGKTGAVWRRYLPRLLSIYITRNDIERVFVSCSKPYWHVLGAEAWSDQVQEVYYHVPQNPTGQAYIQTPKEIGQAIRDLIMSGNAPQPRWRRLNRN